MSSVATLSGTKTVDKNYATLGDVLTYNIPISNSGDTTATNIKFIDTIPSNLTLVPNSLKQDNTNISGSPNSPGVNLSDIGIGATSTITFQVELTSIPSSNPILNSGNFQFSYVIDTPSITITSLATINSSFNTNIATTTFNYINLSASKTVDKDYADLNQALTFTLEIINNGNTTTNMLTLIDTIPAGTTFINNSIRQDGNFISGSPNPPGATLTNIGPNTLSTVTFKTTIVTVPSTGKITNSATTSFNYVIDLNTLPPRIGNGVANTNITSTTILNANLIGSKTVDKNYVTLGDILTYTIPINNTGNTTAINVVFIDTIPYGLTFMSGSLMENGSNISGDPNPPGATLSNIGPNQSSTISFKVMITSIPSVNPILNSGNVQFNYIMNPITTPNIINSGSMNTTITSSTFNYTTISTAKIVNKLYSDILSTITYVIPIFNSGNVSANNIILIDTISDGAIFVDNSITQDGNFILGNPNPPGVILNDIGPSTVSTVTFDVLITTIPTSNSIINSATTSFNFIINPSTIPNITLSAYSNTNIVTTTVLNAQLITSNQVNPDYATFSDIITYTIPITNIGNTTANNIIFSNTIPDGLTFLPGSLTENNLIIAGNPNPPGVNLNDIGPNSTTTVVFKATVTTIPSVSLLLNSSATTTFNYLINPLTIPSVNTESSSNTNVVSTTISIATFETINLLSNLSSVSCNDIITFTVTVPNTGNSTAYNVTLFDTLPNGLTFVPNSVTVNGITIPNVSPLPPSGLNIGTIPAGSISIVTFKMKTIC